MSTFNTRLLVCSLNVSQWAGRKKDKRETAQLAAKHGTPSEIASVHKALLPLAKELDRVHSMTGEIRTYYYDNTAPWEHGGQVLKSTAYMDFSTHIRPMINKWRDAVRVFLNMYPQLVADAAQTMNGLYNPADYPSPDEMERKFSIDIRFRPLPDVNSIIIEAASESEAEAVAAATAELRQELESGLRSQYTDAMQSVWKRLYDTAKHAHERLSDPSNKFHDTLVENARELVRVLPNLNITDDPTLTALTEELRTSLCAHTPEVLRQPGHTRAATATAMADIMSKMSAFYAE